jgi:hypothetical protein
MALTVYVTEDFGTMKTKDRFQRRQVVYSGANVKRLSQAEVGALAARRQAHHMMNMPEEDAPNRFVKVWKELQYKWYCFRLNLSQKIQPKDAPVRATKEAARLRYANTLEQRKILEELWTEIFPNERGFDSEMVLRIPVDTEFLVEDE